MRWVDVCRCLTVAEIPEEAVAATCIVEMRSSGGADAVAGIVELRDREIVGKVDAEDGVVAVAAVVVLTVGVCCQREFVVSTAAGADRLVKGTEAVEARCAAIDMVAAAVVVAGGVVLLAEIGGIDQLRGIHVDTHDVEVLSVGDAGVGIWGYRQT